MLSFRPKSGKSLSFEELFFAHYERLLGWALQLTKRDRSEAEDLVHDLYVQCARTASKPDDIEKLDGYLFSILRNLHYGRLRRAGRSPIDDLSIVDFDSIERGLASVDRRELLYVRASLKSICEYACERKQTSRSASILILRFFFGYYPTEIMRVAQTKRGALDMALQAARQEARLHLERPRVLRSFGSAEPSPSSFPAIPDDSPTIFLELRRAIFKTCVGDCFELDELKCRYDAERPAGFSVAELAHLVSCPVCLDHANKILGLPLLADRSPDETLGRDISQGPDGPPQGPVGVLSPKPRARKSGKDAVQSSLERKTRELFEHRPHTLQIAVDGKPRSSAKVTAEVTDLHLKLSHTEHPEFIEILSEQDLCMIYLHVADPAKQAGLDQVERLALSDGRSLEATLSYASDVPVVHVVYRDPVFLEATSADAIEIQGTLGAAGRLASVAETRPSLAAGRATDSPGPARRLSPATRDDFDQLIPDRPVTADRSWLSSICSALTRIWQSMNPALATAMVLALTASVLFVFGLRQKHRKATASELLTRAAAADASNKTSPRPGVLYQSVRIRTPLRSLERTIYRDAQHKRRAKQQPLGMDIDLAQQLAGAGVSWDAPLSAAGFKDWREHQSSESDNVTRPSGNLIVIRTTSDGNAEVASESLTLRANDLHPIARSIDLRTGGMVEIAELDFGELPWGPATDGFFEPQPSQPVGLPGVHPSLLPRLPRVLSESEFDEAELEARLALHKIGADANERIDIARGSNSVNVRGVVENESRKHEIELQLHLVPNVIAAIYTFDELQRGNNPAAQSSSLAVFSLTATQSPLELYLLNKGNGEEYVRQVGMQLSDASFAVTRETKALADLRRRYAGGARDQLTSNARAALGALVRDHKARLLGALDDENAALVKAGFPVPAEPPPADDRNLESLADVAKALCMELLSGTNTSARPADKITPELARAIAELRRAASHVPEGDSFLQTTATDIPAAQPRS